jgi:Leucine-rich repeat (LRR) protein
LGHNIVDEIPESLYSLSKLRRLNLEDNKLHDLPLKLKELKELHHLSVGNNPIPDSLKPEIEKNFNIVF